MQKDYKQRKKLHIKKRQGVPYTAFSPDCKGFVVVLTGLVSPVKKIPLPLGLREIQVKQVLLQV